MRIFGRGVAVGLLWSAVGCDPLPPPDAEGTTSSAGSTSTAEVEDGGTSTGGPESGDSETAAESSGSSGGPVIDPELDAIANLRSYEISGDECLDLRKEGTTHEQEHGIVVLVDLPPNNDAMPDEETAVRTYELPEDADRVKVRAFLGVPDSHSHYCEADPEVGTEFDVIAGTVTATWQVVDDGCLFTCERLFVELDDLVFRRTSDGATVDVPKLYVPSWGDPSPPM